MKKKRAIAGGLIMLTLYGLRTNISLVKDENSYIGMKEVKNEMDGLTVSDKMDLLLQAMNENEMIPSSDKEAIMHLVPWIEDNPYFNYEYAINALEKLVIIEDATFSGQDKYTLGRTTNQEGSFSIEYNKNMKPEMKPQVQLHELRHVLMIGSQKNMYEVYVTLSGIEYQTDETKPTDYLREVHILRMILELVGTAPVLKAESYKDMTELKEELTECLGSKKSMETVMDSFLKIKVANHVIKLVENHIPLSDFTKSSYELVTGFSLNDNDEGTYSIEDLINYRDGLYDQSTYILYQESKLSTTPSQRTQMESYYEHRLSALENPFAIKKYYFNSEHIITSGKVNSLPKMR